MRHGMIVVGLVMGACFTDPPADGGSSSSGTTSSAAASTSSAGSRTETTDATSSSSGLPPASSSSSSTTGCEDGELDCPCFSNGTCGADLVCAADTCVPDRCGDGMTDPGEDCDDGNPLPGDGCAADCSYETQCFVGNFGGDPIRLASFSIDRAGNIGHRATTTTVGISDPPQSFSDETSLTRRGRFAYLANEDTVESFELGLDGSFTTTSTDLQIPGLLGLATDRRVPWVLAASDDGQFAVHRLDGTPNGSNPTVSETLDVALSNGSHAVLIDFHPQLSVAYVVVEPASFVDNVEVVTLEFNASGELGPAHVEALSNIGFVRGMRAVEQPSQLLLTGIFYATDGNGCFGRVDLLGNGRLSGVIPASECSAPWGTHVGILQPNSDGPVLFGTTAPRIAEWDHGGDADPVNTVQTTGPRHFLRQPWPDMLVVASERELLTVSLSATGSTMEVLDERALETNGLAPDGLSNTAFQAGVLIPCPEGA